jgi:hypothetical protein
MSIDSRPMKQCDSLRTNVLLDDESNRLVRRQKRRPGKEAALAAMAVAEVVDDDADEIDDIFENNYAS